MRRRALLSTALVLLAALFVVGAILYALGLISFLTSEPGASHHAKHALLLIGLAIASLIGANFARPKPA